MKKKFTILLILLSTVINAQLSNATKNKIKVKFKIAKSLFKKENYDDALEKVYEVEELFGKIKNPSLQNLKIKILVAQEDFNKANIELNKINNMNLPSQILDDVASYSPKIEDGLKKIEKEKKEKEKARLAKYEEEERKRKLEKSKSDKQKTFISSILNLRKKNNYNWSKNHNVTKVQYNNKYGVIDIDGNIIIPMKFSNFSNIDFIKNFIVIYKSKSYKDRIDIYNFKGKKLNKKSYSEIRRFKYDRAMVIRQINNDKYDDDKYKMGYIDLNGNEVVKVQYNWLLADDYHYNSKGKTIVGSGKSGYYSTNKKYYLIDKYGKILKILEYSRIGRFSEGLYIVYKKGIKISNGDHRENCGYIDEDGNEVIRPIYSQCKRFENGKALVNYYKNKRNRKSKYPGVYINKKNEIIKK
ncbi:WG repeat-containing protein [Polaribacter aquimarinus]|uniref:WG repeat-containing protein n=1 Tax=Polaribacter aquimarinus TaxID=2100726 RepID=A0A2U2J6T8_9FLAO|nr:WG repeat-containing protein [Polaribacter aquimarinus]PWG04050.1 hypothetical protein DIS07_14765 [Polaribacter aquimarinus]